MHHRIVISGYYGFNNIGDESILKAVVENLRDRIKDIDITVLSQNPESTQEKFGVNAVYRMSPMQIIKTIFRSNLLISGGGSLLQDVTSKKSILYYLAIIWVALFFRKKVFIYSQGIGPVNSKINLKLMMMTLKRVNHIVVRDEGSKEFLLDAGMSPDKLLVTADPVIRIKRPGIEMGRQILKQEGVVFGGSSDGFAYGSVDGFAGSSVAGSGPLVGLAIKGRIQDEEFLEEVCDGIRELIMKYGARVVLIPFHYSEDMPITKEIKRRVGGNVTYVHHKCLTEEMLSVIGNFDILFGVRLHSLIHAAIMEVPMVGISYDPKVNSFMKSMGLRAMCSVYDFKGEYLAEEYEKVMNNREELLRRVRLNKERLINKLNCNEILIKKLLGEK